MKRISYQKFFDEMINSPTGISEHRQFRNFIFDIEGRRAYFSSRVPSEDEYQCIAERRWKEDARTYYIRLFYPVNKISDHQPFHVDRSQLLHHHVGLWQSHLQKAIRLADKHKAMCSAAALLALDPTTLFRRLPIILIEDTCLDATIMPLLTWFMLACPIWTPDEQEFTLLCGILSAMCDLPKRRETANTEEANTAEAKASTVCADTCISLRIRKAYGGTSGDMKMLDMLSDLLRKSPRILHTSPRSFSNICFSLYLEEHEWILSAVDHHVFPKIVKSIFKEKSFLTEKKIRDAIWEESSNVNVRHKKTEQCMLGVWKLIKGVHLRKAKQLLVEQIKLKLE